MTCCASELEKQQPMAESASEFEQELRQAEQSDNQNRASELRREAIDGLRLVSGEQQLLEIYEKEAQYLFNQNRLDEAQELLEEHLANEKLAQYPERHLNALIIQSNVFAQKNLMNEMLQSTDRLMELVHLVEDRRRRAAAYATRAVAMARINPTASVRLYYQALSEFIAVNDRFNEAIARNNLGLLLHEMQDYDAAILEFQQAMEINIQEDNRLDLSRNYNNIANSLSNLGKMDDAVMYMEMSLELNRELDRQTAIVQNYYNLGDTYAEMGDLEEAFNYFDLGYGKSSQMNFVPGLMYTALGLGGWYLKQGDYEQSLHYLNESSDIARSMNQRDVLAKSYNIASGVYEATGNYRQALEHHRKARDLKDSLAVQLRNREIEEIRASYDFDLQASENERLTEQLLYKDRIARVQWLIVGLFLVIGIVSVTSAVVITRKQNKLSAAYLSLEKSHSEIIRKNSQLESLNRELISLHEEKNKLVDIMVHDLRNPLASVVGFLDIAMDTENREDNKMYLSMAVEGSKRLKSLIDSLLQVHTLQKAQENADLEWCDISSLATECVKTYESVAQQKQISLVAVTEPPKVATIPSYITRVLDNLVSNAIKFSPPNTAITVKASRLDEEFWQLSVKDQGPGLSEEDMQKAFTMFGRLSARPTGGEESLGLGLFAVKILVEKLRGTISVQNNAEAGACFECTFPESAGTNNNVYADSSKNDTSALKTENDQ